MPTSGDKKGSMTLYSTSTYNNKITAVPKVNKIIIDATGMKLIQNGSNYMKLNHDGTMICKHGGYEFGFGETGTPGSANYKKGWYITRGTSARTYL